MRLRVQSGVSTITMRVYCTCPCSEGESPEFYDIPNEELLNDPLPERRCSCGLPLFLRERYVPIRVLGNGGFGRTFVVIDLNSGSKSLEGKSRRILKQFYPRQALSPSALATARRLFQQEAAALDHLRHHQIPRFYEYFRVTIPSSTEGSQEIFFYLVQECVEGEDLERWVFREGPRSESEVLHVLEQVLRILRYTHSRQPQAIIHRDIKPSNIMRRDDGEIHLIDFGAVKEVILHAQENNEGSEITELSSGFTRIYTPGYSPPEQGGEDGRITPSSDLFALAATCVYLLTGQRPTSFGIPQNLQTWNRSIQVQVQSAFVAILNRMLNPIPTQRYQTAEDVIAALQSAGLISTIPYWIIRFAKLPKWVFAIAALSFIAVGVAGTIGMGFLPKPCAKLSCDERDRLSWGEQFILPLKREPERESKLEEARKAFVNGNYQKAREKYEVYFQRYQNDPEALIYLNNATAMEKGNPLSIAVVIPIQSKTPKDEDEYRKNDPADEILRGVAQAQNEFNQSRSINNRLLLVQIASDDYDKDVAEDTAKRLVNDKRVLGVIGNYATKEMLRADKIYSAPNLKDQKLVSISPTSTAVKSITNKFRDCKGLGSYNFSNYILRTASTDTVAAEDLVDRMIEKKAKRAFVIYDPKSIFSCSISGEFERLLRLKSREAKVTGACPIEEAFKGGKRVENEVKNRCIPEARRVADTLLLAIPFDKARRAAGFIGDFNKAGSIILGSDPAYSQAFLDFGENFQNLIVAVPWHRSRSFDENNQPQSDFEQLSFKLWGDPNFKVNWRTAMSYDATQVMIRALRDIQNNPTRLGLFNELQKATFVVRGAAGNVTFTNGDRNLKDTELGVLVKIQKIPETSKYQFVLLDGSKHLGY